jgi:hypothetical protein
MKRLSEKRTALINKFSKERIMRKERYTESALAAKERFSAIGKKGGSASRKGQKERMEANRKNKELVYTDPELIRASLSVLLEDAPYLWDGRQWHDPFAADARWAKVAREEFGIKNIRSSDLVSRADGVEQLNVFDIEPDPNVFYFGNLPFSLTKQIYYHFDNCHRFFIGGRCFNRFGGINYNLKQRPFEKRKLFYFPAENKHKIVSFAINYSRPCEPLVPNKIISGYEWRELTTDNQENYINLYQGVEYLLKDGRHRDLELL